MRLAAAAFVLALGLGQADAAADEGETALSGSLSFATFAVPDHDAVGGALGIDYERGLTRSLWLRASAGGGLYSEDDSLAGSVHGTVGVTYAFDVLKYVPYANLGIGGIYVGGGSLEESHLEPLVEIGGGLDILVSRNVSWGLVARFESFLDRTAFFTAGARLTYRWGFF